MTKQAGTIKIRGMEQEAMLETAYATPRFSLKNRSQSNLTKERVTDGVGDLRRIEGLELLL